MPPDRKIQWFARVENWPYAILLALSLLSIVSRLWLLAR